jgi:hypothetical protein
MKSGVTFEINVLQRLAAEQRAAIQQAQRHRTTSPYTTVLRREIASENLSISHLYHLTLRPRMQIKQIGIKACAGSHLIW